MYIRVYLFYMCFRIDCIFSFNDRMVLIGIFVKKEGDGKFFFLDRELLDIVLEIIVVELVSFL